MSRNSNRFQGAPPPGGPQPPNFAPPVHQQQSPFPFSFVVPTEIVELPSKGKFYGPSNSLQGKSQIEIKHLTAKEEDILINESYIAAGIVFDKLLESIVVDKTINPSDLLSGDRNALLIKARSLGYGSEYALNLMCPKCSSVEDFVFNIDLVSTKENNFDDLTFDVTFDENHGIFRFEVEKSDLTIGIRLLSSAEENNIASFVEKQESLGLESNQTVNFLRQAIVEANGVTEKAIINQLVDVLPATDARRIRAVYKRAMPDVSTEQTVVCPKCKAGSDLEVPFTMGFFWSIK